MTNENERKNTLFVFVGEKIEAKRVPVERGSFDAEMKARYKVLQRVYGNYDKDEIEFTAFDHYSRFPLSDYKHVLLFVSEYKGKYYHEKYQYNDVYKTKNGRWAGRYARGDYKHVYNDSTTIKPERIVFAEEVAYPLKIVENGDTIEFDYPEPYFKIKGDKAIVVYGNYVEELFKLKRDGVLTARELFGIKPPDKPVEVQEVILEQIKPVPTKEDLRFNAFWKKTFIPIIRSGSIQQLKAKALDSIYVCGSLQSIDEFNRKCYRKIFDKPFFTASKDSNAISNSTSKTDTAKMWYSAKKRIIKTEDKFVVRKVWITKNETDTTTEKLLLFFIPTKKGYTLGSVAYVDRRKCCE